VAGPQQDPKQSPSRTGGTGKRTRLAPSVKYQVFVEVLTGQSTQGEAADKYGVNRMTVNQICKTAKQGALDALAGTSTVGRPGKSPEVVELEAARKEIERLRATVTEQAVALHLHQGKSLWG
jgi:transposase-like protein